MSEKHRDKNMRLLLDDNVLIDYLTVREPFYHDARLIMLLGSLNEVELWLGIHQINDVFYVISKGAAKSSGLTWQSRFKQLREFVHLCGTLETDFDAALDLGWDDLKNALVYQCAQKVRADFIITRDAGGFIHSQIPILCPADFFAWLKLNKGLTYAEVYLPDSLKETLIERMEDELDIRSAEQALDEDDGTRHSLAQMRERYGL